MKRSRRGTRSKLLHDTRVRRLVLSASLFLGISSAFVATGPDALAACGGSSTYGNIGVQNVHSPTYGTKGSGYVNNFGSHQTTTWRAVAVLGTYSNFAEVGWVTEESAGDQLARPYKTEENDGIAHTTRFPNRTLTQDAMHTFSVKDINDDNDYDVAVDGDPLGADLHVTINPDNSTSETQTERQCTSDSLWTQFRNLQFFRSTGNPSDWADKAEDTATNHSPYDYCTVSPNAWDAKQTCP